MNRFTKHLCKLLRLSSIVTLLIFQLTSISLAETDLDLQLPNAVDKDFLSLELTQNYPTSTMAGKLNPDSRQLHVTYYHLLNKTWAVGISAGFKSFKFKASNDSFALFNISNYAYYMIRLSHPLYLWAGGRWLYLMPIEKPQFPFRRNDDFQNEIGIAASLLLTYFTSDDLAFTFRVDRWRGTGTDNLHGIEVATGIAWSGPFTD